MADPADDTKYNPDDLDRLAAEVEDLLSYVTSPDDTPTDVYARVVAAKAH